MVHNQIQEVQQKMNNAYQVLGQLRQSEEGAHQKLMQLAYDESHVAQQLHCVQQICQESMNNLQSIASSLQQHAYSPSYTSGQGSFTAPHSQHGSSPLFNLSTMGPSTYQDTKRFMSGQGMTGHSSGGQTPLSSIATMGPSTYQSSQEQLGQSSPSLSQIGQQAGISTK